MSILSMKSEFLLPERELIINKYLTIRQRPSLIASITEQEGVRKLWVFQQMPDSTLSNVSEEDLNKCVTNRDEIWKRTLQTRIGCDHISEMTIQGITLQFERSSADTIGHNVLAYMKLQHFIEAGVDFTPIEDINFIELALAEYQLSEETAFPEIDADADMPISLKIIEGSCEVLVEPSRRFSLRIGEQDITHSFIDPLSGKEIEYHINELVCYDIWNETLKQFQNEEMLSKLRECGHDDAAIEKIKADIPKSLVHVCPENHFMLIINYECDDDIQLNFYSSEFLLKRPESNGSFSSVFLMNSSGEKGRYGHHVRTCLIKTVPVDFDETVEVELMSWYRKIPVVTIEA